MSTEARRLGFPEAGIGILRGCELPTMSAEPNLYQAVHALSHPSSPRVLSVLIWKEQFIALSELMTVLALSPDTFQNLPNVAKNEVTPSP